MASRCNLVYTAKLAEQAERYDEVIDAMKKVAKLGVELTTEERNLLSLGHKNVLNARRASLRMLSSIEQKEEAKGNEHRVKHIKEYRQKVESEMSAICNDIMTVIDEHLLPSASEVESTVFYYKMKGDYYRYLAEFRTGDKKKEVADKSMKAYETASTFAEADLAPTNPIRLGLALNFSVFYHEIMNSVERFTASTFAEADLAPTNPIRLGLALNFSVFYHEIMNSVERACYLANKAFDEALPELDNLSSESYKESTLLLGLLRDNHNLWTSI